MADMVIEGIWLSVILFVLGLIGVLVRRNLIFVLLSIEVMLNAAALLFVLGGTKWGQPDGQVMYLFIVTVAAAEVAVGLALVLQLFGHFRTLSTGEMNTLRG